MKTHVFPSILLSRPPTKLGSVVVGAQERNRDLNLDMWSGWSRETIGWLAPLVETTWLVILTLIGWIVWTAIWSKLATLKVDSISMLEHWYNAIYDWEIHHVQNGILSLRLQNQIGKNPFLVDLNNWAHHRWFMQWYMPNNALGLYPLEGMYQALTSLWWLNCGSIMPDLCQWWLEGEFHCRMQVSAVMVWTRGLYPLIMPCPAHNFKFSLFWWHMTNLCTPFWVSHPQYVDWSLFSFSYQLHVDPVHLNELNWYSHDKF